MLSLCSYDFPLSPAKYIPLYGGAEYHDYHHYVGGQSQSNFTSVFTYCDYIYGTDKMLHWSAKWMVIFCLQIWVRPYFVVVDFSVDSHEASLFPYKWQVDNFRASIIWREFEVVVIEAGRAEAGAVTEATVVADLFESMKLAELRLVLSPRPAGAAIEASQAEAGAVTEATVVADLFKSMKLAELRLVLSPSLRQQLVPLTELRDGWFC
ncbi:methylsterol monooxygenase 1-1-like protein [Cinnamomum micranthum f. kanehirae]|uniref:Methylsterol monooxygenase 1-1-like protein n=1 Tax=Cinnamomum micranthum f. kanehirae TaxID=337451 RepID=A0A443NBA1_9MAGN|nr:methylsterol monooxygenase 1-1-like protein [Cinnamomum micranthum f. kanehirae]